MKNGKIVTATAVRCTMITLYVKMEVLAAYGTIHGERLKIMQSMDNMQGTHAVGASLLGQVLIPHSRIQTLAVKPATKQMLVSGVDL